MNDQSFSIVSWFPFNLLILLPLMGVFNEEKYNETLKNGIASNF